MPKTPFVQGAAAREAGRSIKRNPYPVGSDDHNQWNDGFRSTKKLRLTATEQLDDLITELSARCKLDGWELWVEGCDLPMELVPAAMTRRRELINLAQARAMNAEEVGKLFKLIGVLLDTNFALQTHAEQVAIQVKIWRDAFTQLETVGNRIEHFANFRRTLAPEDEEEALTG